MAHRTGLGQVRDNLYGVEREFADLQLPQGDALHCFVNKRYAPGYIGWVAQNQPACRWDWRCVMTRNRYGAGH